MNGFSSHGDISIPYDINEAYDDYTTPGFFDSVDLSEFHPDAELKFITKILMEEDVDDQMYMVHGGSDLVAAVEKPFYEILAGNYTLDSPDGPPIYAESYPSPDDSGGSLQFSDLNSGTEGNYHAASDGWDAGIGELMYPPVPDANGLAGYAYGTIPDSVWQFNKGFEEASKFLPDSSKLIINAMGKGTIEDSHDAAFMPVVVKTEREWEETGVDQTRGVKNHYHDDFDAEEGRSSKQQAVGSGDQAPKELYDEVLLCKAVLKHRIDSDEGLSFRSFECARSKKSGESKVSNGGQWKGSRQEKKEVVDLRSLLILCAQSIAADDRVSANAQLRQIRQHSSSSGDGSQRLAHYFADGLEARLAGIGSEVYRSHMMAKRGISTTVVLKAYQAFLSSCPFIKISHAFANQIILRTAPKGSRIHIVDFGIRFGFHWPCLIQMLSLMRSGTTKLRITGIDFPEPGFRPSKRLEETGRHLAEYAMEFNVPFEYHHIAAAKWEEIRIEDLEIREDEFLVATSMNMLHNIADESVSIESPRNIVLNNIRKMNPVLFIVGIDNGSYSSPFFVTRFREALFHFSALFDAFDSTMTREDPNRQCLERELLGQEVLNVVACEGSERVHRPETYKQWQVRNQRCGFSQLPLDPEIFKIFKDKIMPQYNKDFLIDKDGKWMLQSWKGRVLQALSAWKPTNAGI